MTLPLRDPDDAGYARMIRVVPSSKLRSSEIMRAQRASSI
jgi:hypothetical protein